MTSINTDGEQRSTRTRVVVVGGIVPVVMAVVASALMTGWLPDLPDPVATHWGSSGPDGFGSPWSLLVIPGTITVAYTVFAVIIAWRTTPAGRLTWMQKFVVASAVWVGALLSIGMTGTVAVQRGLADARDAGDISLLMLLGAAVGLVLAVGSWFLLPPADRAAAHGVDPEPLHLAPTERVSWSNSASMSRVTVVVIGIGLAFSLGSVVIMALTAPDGVVFALVAFVLLLAASLATAWWRVTADHRGLRVVSALGWPRAVIPAEDIRAVQVITVNPAADFGGWGWRWDGGDRTGVITRRGPAIQVTRASGRKFVVTVDRAETAASVLATVAGAPAR